MAYANPEGPSTAEDGIFGVGVAPDEAAVILVPAAFDATASYGRRAADGPAAILAASPQLDLFDAFAGDILSAGGVAMLEAPDEWAALNAEARAAVDRVRAGPDAPERELSRVNAIGERVNELLDESVQYWLDRDRIVGVVGGDHSTPFANISAHLQRFPRAGILHIDAHADLRDAYEGFTWSHASIMHNVLERTAVERIVQVGIRDFAASEYERCQSDARLQTFFMSQLDDERFNGAPWSQLCDRIVAALPSEVYVSFDIDGLDPSLCPNTGTPVPGGASFNEAIHLLRTVVRSGRRIVGFDLNEVAPGNDGEWDGNVGARILYQLCLLSSMRRDA